MNKNNKLRKIKIIGVITFIILFVLYSYISYRSEYLQVLEIGEDYLSVFYRNNEYKNNIFWGSFVILFIMIFLINKSIKKGLKVFFDDEKKEIPKLPNKSIAFIISILGSLFITSVFLDKTILFLNNTWFGISDPVFGIDIGFFFFQKPFIELILKYVITVLIFATVYMVVYYIVVFNICLNGIDKEVLLKSKLIKGLKVNAILIAILIAIGTFMDTYNIVFSEFLFLKDGLSTKLTGAGVTDVTIKLWGYRFLGIIIVLSVALIIKNILKKDRTKQMIASICLVPGYLVCLFIIIILFNSIFVNPNKLDVQKEYIGYNKNYTKQAYNLNIEEIEYQNSEGINKVDIEENEDIINNINILNKDAVLKTLNTLQTNSGYYSYRTTTLQKYKINDEEILTYVSPREINASIDLSTDNKTYEYTHGFGSIITYASKVDSTGNAQYIQKGFELENNVASIEQPRIYFGMQTNSTIITNSKNKSEFDYPITSTTSIEYAYDGCAGIKLGFLDKLILSIMNSNVNITFSNTTKDSKVIVNRNILERVKKIMPQLQYDEDPYFIISDEGKQIWVIDAYTISNAYPYSQRIKIDVGNYKKEINYIRNSIKVLVDAYNGTVNFYIMDKTDPIAVAYQNIYPNIFKDGDLISNSISSHFVYPEYLYNIQSDILKIYHNVSEDVLYRGNDIWDYASHSTSLKTSVTSQIQPYYTMVKEEGENLIGLVIPYTIEGRQNITSYLIGTNKNGKLKLKLYKYASGTNIIGPEQLDRQIEQDETISAQIKSVNVTGTKIIKNLIIVPINNSLLYVEPIYQQQLNEKNAIPLLKKVVVASGNKVAIGDNIQEALKNLVSQSAVNIKVQSTDTLEDLINTIIEANNNLKESTQSQNFEMIGKDITKLQELINMLEKQSKDNKEDEEIKQEDSLINNSQKTVENIINN